MTYRIIAGPTDVIVERHGVRSASVAIDDNDGAADIRRIGAELWEDIRPLVSWAVWKRHRLTMAAQRRIAAMFESDWPGPYFAGPRPDLVAQRPWEDASFGEWRSLPNGVVSHLLRSQR